MLNLLLLSVEVIDVFFCLFISLIHLFFSYFCLFYLILCLHSDCFFQHSSFDRSFFLQFHYFFVFSFIALLLSPRHLATEGIVVVGVCVCLRVCPSVCPPRLQVHQWVTLSFRNAKVLHQSFTLNLKSNC